MFVIGFFVVFCIVLLLEINWLLVVFDIVELVVFLLIFVWVYIDCFLVLILIFVVCDEIGLENFMVVDLFWLGVLFGVFFSLVFVVLFWLFVLVWIFVCSLFELLVIFVSCEIEGLEVVFVIFWLLIIFFFLFVLLLMFSILIIEGLEVFFVFFVVFFCVFFCLLWSSGLLVIFMNDLNSLLGVVLLVCESFCFFFGVFFWFMT